MPTRIKVEIPLKVVDDIVKSDDVGLFTAATWARYMDKYVPYYEGMLSTTADTTEPFKITYTQEYSRYQWKGVSKSGKALNHSKEEHPLATSHWEEPAYARYKDNVAQEITAYLRRKT